MTTQEHNKEAATVSPVVLISSKYEKQQGDNTNYAVNLLASLHQIPDVGRAYNLSRLLSICAYRIQA
jgi:hypothetical protein